VYPNFLPDTHVYAQEQEDKFFARSHYCNHTILLGIDFGWQNPSACLFVAKVGERYFVFDEIYGSHIPIENFADMIREKLAQWGITHYIAYADIDYQLTNILRNRGVFTMPARKHDKFTRIEYVRQQFNVNAQSGLPNIMLHARCRFTVNELLEYHYPDSNRDDINPSEQPVEKDNHGCDALSYLVWTPQYALYSSKKREKVK